jgi:farnesyl diphosphate synthase
MRYAVLDGGKRLRPLLVLASQRGGAGQRVGGTARGLRGGVDPRLFAGARRHALHGQRRAASRQAHGARAVRRGPGLAGRRRPAGAGLRAADARRRRMVPPAMQAALCGLLARAAGAAGMAGGQAIDLASVGKRADRSRVARPCTGSRPARCCRLRAHGRGLRGAGAAGAARAALDDYGAAIGLAFQVVDDILDVTADSVRWARPPARTPRPTSPPTSRCWVWPRPQALAARCCAGAPRARCQRPGHGGAAAQLADRVVMREN